MRFFLIFVTTAACSVLWPDILLAQRNCIEFFKNRQQQLKQEQSQRDIQVEHELQQWGFVTVSVDDSPVFFTPIAGKESPHFFRIEHFPKSHWLYPLRVFFSIKNMSLYVVDNGENPSVDVFYSQDRKFIVINKIDFFKSQAGNQKIIEAVVRSLVKDEIEKMYLEGELKTVMTIPQSSEDPSLGSYSFQDIRGYIAIVSGVIPLLRLYKNESSLDKIQPLSLFLQNKMDQINEMQIRARLLLQKAEFLWRFEPERFFFYKNGDLSLETSVDTIYRDQQILLQTSLFPSAVEDFLSKTKDILDEYSDRIEVIRRQAVGYGVDLSPWNNQTEKFESLHEKWRQVLSLELGISPEENQTIQNFAKTLSGRLLEINGVEDSFQGHVRASEVDLVRRLPKYRGYVFARISNLEAELLHPQSEIILSSVAPALRARKSVQKSDPNTYQVAIHSLSGRNIHFLASPPPLESHSGDVLFLQGTRFRVTAINQIQKTIILEEIPRQNF